MGHERKEGGKGRRITGSPKVGSNLEDAWRESNPPYQTIGERLVHGFGEHTSQVLKKHEMTTLREGPLKERVAAE